MNDTFQRHESCVHYQEAFCQCLGAFLEAIPQLHMFVDDTGIDKHDSTHIRYPLCYVSYRTQFKQLNTITKTELRTTIQSLKYPMKTYKYKSKVHN